MVIILLSIACIANSVSIILLWVSHVRGNRRGKGPTLSDLKRADAIQRYIDKVVTFTNPFDCFKNQSHD